MKTSEILRIARSRVEKGWCQGSPAMMEDGSYIVEKDSKIGYWQQAGRFCSWGAVRSTEYMDGAEYEWWLGAYRLLEKICPTGNIIDWNDVPNRTQAEVLDLFDRTIALAEKE